MKLNKNINYSYSFPKLSEYRVKLFSPLLIVSVTLIAIIYLRASKELTTDYFIQVILFAPGLYLTVMILIMIYKTLILIRARIMKVCEENSGLSRKGHIYKNNLLVCADESNERINEKKAFYLFVVLMLFFFLSKKLIIDIQYIKWGGSFILIFFLLIRLRDISRFFYDLANANHQNIIRYDRFSRAFLRRDIINWKTFEGKWRIALIINIILFISTIILLFTLKDFKGTICSASSLIAAVTTFIIAWDINTVIKSNLAIMGEYDAYVKTELGMKHYQSKEIMPSYLNDEVTLESSIPTFIKTAKKIKEAVKNLLNRARTYIDNYIH